MAEDTVMSEICEKCGLELQNDINILNCDFCSGQFHIACVNISPDEVHYLRKINGVMWKCGNCVYDKSDINELNNRLKSMESLLKGQSEIIKRHDLMLQGIKSSLNPIVNRTPFSATLRSPSVSLTATPRSSNVNNKRNYAKALIESENINSEKKSRTEVSAKKRKESEKAVLYVKPKNASKKTRDDAKNNIKSLLDPTKDPIIGLKSVNKDGIVIQCTDAAAAAAIFEKIDSQMKDNFEVRKSERRWPNFLISGIDPDEYTTDNEFIEQLKNENECFTENCHIKIVKKLNNNKNIVVETDIDTRNKLVHNKTVRVGWMICNVVEYVNVLRCYNCHSFGHSASKCTNATVCSICTGSHSSKTCKIEQFKCVNCTNFNENLQDKSEMFDVNHPVFSLKCPIYKHKIELKRSKVQYFD